MTENVSQEVRELLEVLRTHFESSKWKDTACPTQAEEMDKLREVIHADRMSGLWLAHKCACSPETYGSLLREALETEDASHVRWWLVVGISRIGYQVVLDLMGREDAPRTNALLGSLYWMPQLLPAEALELEAQLAAVARQIMGKSTY
jgi:hypothetical protein